MTGDLIRADVLVVGGGLAGGVAALTAADSGADVVVLSKGPSASSWAQGGIIDRGPGDPGLLMTDILNAGAGRNFKPAVELVAAEGPSSVDRWLRERLAVNFDSELALEAAHSVARIKHVKDSTGAAIMERLDAALAQHPRIRRVEGVLVDLLTTHLHDRNSDARYKEGRVVGAYGFFDTNKAVVSLVASSVVLATGGFSQLYLHATGPHTNRGDGISAAQRVGARTLDMEFVQFHPTTLYVPGKPRRLLTEALRGAGAQILNLKLERFIDSLAPRDVVSRAIHEELAETLTEHVWLDLRSVPNLSTQFPGVCSLLESENFDPRSDLIPIVPAAHYTLGGVWTDLNARTSIQGLLAAGEVACTGLHGANRLASTSLLEALVFGERAGRSAVQDSAAFRKLGESFDPRPWMPANAPVDSALVQQDLHHLKNTCGTTLVWCGLKKRLAASRGALVELRSEVETFYRRAICPDELIGLRHGF